MVSSLPSASWSAFQTKEQVRDSVTVGGTGRNRAGLFFCRPRQEGAKVLVECARLDTILYSNLGAGEVIDERLKQAGVKEKTSAQGVIALAHGRGSASWCIEDSRASFMRNFRLNGLRRMRRGTYLMAVAFLLFESFMEVFLAGVVPLAAYATRVCRTAIDFAAKRVQTGGKTMLKVTAATEKTMQLDTLWKRCVSPPRVA
jgi:hypothetical protein